MALFGIVLTALLVIKKVPGGILISIIVVTILGIFVKDPTTGLSYTVLPDQLVSFQNPGEALSLRHI